MVPDRLKPQDVVLALKLASLRAQEWNQPDLARSLHISASEVNHGLRRLSACHLFNPIERRLVRASLREFLVSGLRYVFPAELGFIAQGMPTAFSARPLSAKVRVAKDEGAIWYVEGGKGKTRGRVVTPLYPTAPLAAAEDSALHEYLALADGLRVGRARERKLAADELTARLDG